MTAEEFSDIRRALGLSRREFGRALGFKGKPQNVWRMIRRMEDGTEDVGQRVQDAARAMAAGASR